MANEKTTSFHYGGQAVIEGVMMRGKSHFAVACRRASGEIATTAEHVEKGILGKLQWLNKPVLRGTLALIDTFALGMKALMWSANQVMEDEELKQAASSDKLAEPAKSSKVNDIVLSVTPLLAIPLAIMLFVYIPAYLSRLALGGVTGNRAWLGLLEGGIKIAMLFLYVWSISRWKDIRRIFEYHGGEHKVINAYEAGEELTVENVQKYSTVHVRCGTSFLLVVILVGIIVFAAVPWNFAGPLWLAMLKRAAFKLPLLIPVAGIAYEVIKFAGSRKTSLLTRVLLGPGMLMQRITTQEPSDEQVEVAIKSFQSVIQAEEEEKTASVEQDIVK